MKAAVYMKSHGKHLDIQSAREKNVKYSYKSENKHKVEKCESQT